MQGWTNNIHVKEAIGGPKVGHTSRKAHIDEKLF